MSTRRQFTFIVGGERHIIAAATARDAMVVANRGLLPVNFYAWMEAGTDTFQATTGVWD